MNVIVHLRKDSLKILVTKEEKDRRRDKLGVWD